MRLIDAEKLERSISEGCAVLEDRSGLLQGNLLYERGVYRAIANAETVDAVPVVRCKDCTHAEMYRFGTCDYHLACVSRDEDGDVHMATSVDENDFCSKGERT